MIDTHSHLYEPEFDDDRDACIQRAKDAGVEKILLPNINRESLPRMLDLCRQHPGYCFPMIGLHPEDVRDDHADVLDEMERLLAAPDHPFVGVGEVGIDLYWDKTYREQQIAAFERQIQWATTYRLPLMIHTRAAHQEMMIVMRRHQGEHLTGVFHCFSGSPEMAHDIIALPGFCLGIGGVLTYKKSRLPETLATAVPLDRIVVETDCPYLAPVPHRGRRNESAYVADVVRQIAHIYKVSEQEAERQTTDNAMRLFPRLRRG